jgi:hypothetical protein
MKLPFATRLWAIAIIVAVPSVPSFAFDTSPWSGGSLNYGGLGSTTRAYAKAASAEARANAIDGPAVRRGSTIRAIGIDTSISSACIVNVGGAVANTVGDGAINIVQFTGDIVQICR